MGTRPKPGSNPLPLPCYGKAMVTFTDAAREQIVRDLDVGPRNGGDQTLALRLSAHRISPGDFHYDLTIVGRDEREPGDTVVDDEDFQVFVDPESAPVLRGTVVGFERELQRMGFPFDNPNVGWNDPVAQKTQQILDTRINPAVASHGGRGPLGDYRDGTVFLGMGGGCQGCGKAEETLRAGVEAMLREAVPEVEEIVDTTDHTAGLNPYFRSQDEGRSPVE